MTQLEFSKLRPGMVTAEDIRDRSGRLLLPANTALTEARLRVLKTWGILQVAVHDETAAVPTGGQGGGAALSANAQRRATEEMDRKFALNNLKHEAVQRIYDYCLFYRARQISDENDTTP